MRKTLIGASILLALSGILVFKGLRGLDRLNKELEESTIPDLLKVIKEKEQEASQLKAEIDDYHRKLDEQIKETEKLIMKLKEDHGIDPREIDIQIDPV